MTLPKAASSPCSPYSITLIRDASTSRPKIKAIGDEIAALQRQLGADSITPADADAVAKQLESLLTRLNPQKLTGGEPNEIGNYVSEVKGLKERLQKLRAKPPVDISGNSGNVAGADDDGGGTGGDDGGGDDGGGDEQGDGKEPGAGAGAGDDGNAQDEGDRWTTDEVLPALRTVMIRELGEDETDRLFDLAIDELEAG